VLDGAWLTLLIGPGTPVPAPAAVTDALTGVQVQSDKERTGFQLSFTIGRDSPLLTTLIPAGAFDPMVTRVILIATVGGIPQVLSDGMITRQDLAPSSDPGKSTFTVTGEDLSVLMDVVEMPFMRYPGMPEVAIVNSVLARYAALGMVPLVIPPVSTWVPIPTEKIPTQTGTDRAYVRALAARNGYVFYVEPGPAPGMNLAYWGPDVRLPVPQPALNVNFDAHTNVESLSFGLDGLSKKIVVITIFDPVTNKITIPIPVPNVSVLRPPLGARVAAPARVEFPESISKLNASEAVARALSIVFEASDSITASGSLDVLRYGRLLRSRQLVGVRGAGVAYDGLYYVQSVTHSIKHGEYKQSFGLSRDGLISLTPAVVP
jgi:hypothetical protein